MSFVGFLFSQLGNWYQSSVVKIKKRLQHDLATIPFHLIILFLSYEQLAKYREGANFAHPVNDQGLKSLQLAP